MSTLPRGDLHVTLRVTFGLLVTSLMACAQLGAPPREAKVVACLPEFPYAEGWLGGDAAYSVALDDGRTLWLFGDSFVGEADARNRVGAAFVHNSIGLSTCASDGFEISYYWGESASGEAQAFFDSGTGSPYWWLFDGFAHADHVYVGLLEVSEAEPDPTLQLPFRPTGMRLARIANPRDDPSTWQVTVAGLSRSQRAFPAASMVVKGTFVYFFAFEALREGRQARFLARLPLVALDPFPEDLSPHLETWSKQGDWVEGFQPDRARILMDDAASEMSVEFHPGLGRWVAIYGAPVQVQGDSEPATHGAAALSDQIFLRTAERLEGPWSERRLVYQIPELRGNAASQPPDPNTLCYAAKGHREFSSPGFVLITYVCNLYTKPGEDPWAVLGRLSRNMELYRPRPVLAPIPRSD